MKVCAEAAAPVLLIRIVCEPTVAEFGSKTLTLIPSPAESARALTEKVVDVAPEAIVAEPDCASKSAAVALSTVPPLSLPITVHENDVSDVTAELAVIVNVTSLPSSTLEPDLESVYVGEAEELTALPETVTFELPAEEPEEGKVATPIEAANSASVLEDPETPAVALPPTSYVKLLAPLIVTTAPFDNVSCTASAANLDEATESPSTN